MAIDRVLSELSRFSHSCLVRIDVSCILRPLRMFLNGHDTEMFRVHHLTR
jgi:hypothetical protein